MKLVEINKKQLNNFLTEQNKAQFLQSWEWGEFQKSVGFVISRFVFEKKGKIVTMVTLVKKNLFGGWNYFYSPGGGHNYWIKN